MSSANNFLAVIYGGRQGLLQVHNDDGECQTFVTWDLSSHLLLESAQEPDIGTNLLLDLDLKLEF
jgi:hypothetical protein